MSEFDDPVYWRFARRCGELVPDAEYANPFHDDPAARWRDRLYWIAAIGLFVAMVTSPLWWPK